MTKLEIFILKHFNLDASDMMHLPGIAASMQVELEEGNYDDPYGRVSEYTLIDAFDDKLYALLDKAIA
jgi:hypothetical protein